MSNQIEPTAKKKCRYTLSVVMIVKNEAENLKSSLPAVAGWVDEIIILDSGSTDNSEAVAKEYGAKWFVNTDWQGFGKQRQIAQGYAKGDWVLTLDADEVISTTLKNSILSVIQQPPEQTVYGLSRVDFIFGQPIDNPRWFIPLKAHWRLYPRYFRYGDNQVHESLEINATTRTQRLNGYLYHLTADQPLFLLSKRLDYAMTWAESQYQKGRRCHIGSVLGHAIWSFIKIYFIEGRIFKGRYGLIYATLFAQYTFNKYALLYDLIRQKRTKKKVRE